MDEKVIRERKASLKTLLKNEGADLNHENLDDVQRMTEIRQKSGKWLDFLDILILTRVSNGILVIASHFSTSKITKYCMY